MNYQGYVIYRERVRRNWSQAGLCSGICTVSYLSKIESGKAEPSEEILRLLLERLELKSDPEMEREAAALAERGWELLFSGRNAQLSGLLGETELERARAVPAWLDLALLCTKSRWMRSWSPAWTHGSLPCSGSYRAAARRRRGSCQTPIPT